MGVSSQSVRLFISSTFSDFHHERDVLQTRVFPYLADICRVHGVEFQAVDLRWGIREEEAFEQQTLDICLREIQRCLDVSPIPNFLILLGERYGWQPLPGHIPEVDFNAIQGWIINQRVGIAEISPEAELSMLNRWYRLDANALPPCYRLQPRTGDDITLEVWEHTESTLRDILRAVVANLGWESPRTDRYLLSATAQEIMQGVLGDAFDTQTVEERRVEVREHVFCFHRKRLGGMPNEQSPVSKYFNDTNKDGEQDFQSLEKLNQLSVALQQRLGNNYLKYQAFATVTANGSVTKDDISTHHLDAFASDARHLLEAVIRSEIDRMSKVTEIEREKARHEAFLKEKVRQFVGRSAQLERVSAERFLGGRTLIFQGPGGVGKSSLMAKVIESALLDGCQTVFRFLGLTSDASTGVSLLASLCHELADLLNDSVEQRVDVAGWSIEFKRLIQRLAQSSLKLIIAIDAVDQLPADDPALEFEWLPKELPTNVRLIISTLEGDVLTSLKRRIIGADYERIGELELFNAEILLKEWLAANKRQLQPKQTHYILDLFKQNGLPLYLRLATEEARWWTSYSDSPDTPMRLEGKVDSLIEQIFKRLELPQNHGLMMVSRTLGYLVVARNGLTESELIDVLSADDELMEQFRKDSPQGKDLNRLPFIVWSRLRDDLESYLSERQANGLPAIGFFHRIFREVAERRFLGTDQVRHDLHQSLAEYFGKQSNYLDANEQKRANRRRLSELPFHLMHSRQIRVLSELITDADYFDAKLGIGDRYELFTEYLQCREAMQKKHQSTSELQQLARELAKHVIRQIDSEQDSVLDIEDLHAFLAFRKDTQLYRDLLEAGTSLLKTNRQRTRTNSLQRLYLGMRARQGNLLRRDGDLEAAEKLLAELQIELVAFGPSAELSRVEYDLGYIAYLEGDLERGATLIEKSAKTALQGDNEFGHWISACVAAHQRWLLALENSNGIDATYKMHEVLDQALEVFERRKFDDTTSERWVMNVHAHRFNLAYRAKDGDKAKSILEFLENDPWLKGFGDDITVARYRARLAILEGRYIEGANGLKALSMMRLKRSDKEESLAEDFMDAGFGYRLGGDEKLARQMWNITMKLPRSYGNSYWQNIVRSLSLQ